MSSVSGSECRVQFVSSVSGPGRLDQTRDSRPDSERSDCTRNAEPGTRDLLYLAFQRVFKVVRVDRAVQRFGAVDDAGADETRQALFE